MFIYLDVSSICITFVSNNKKQILEKDDSI